MKQIFKISLMTGLSAVMLMGMTGRELAEKIDAIPKPKDNKADMTMVLTNKTGKTQSKSIRSIGKDNNKKQIIWFLEPARDKGVAFLKIEHADAEDEMNLWLPAFNKVRRIRSSDKGDSFMGSDVSYEDMNTRELDEYEFTLAGETDYNGHACYILESKPLPKAESNYSKIISKVDKTTLQVLYEEYFDLKGNLYKTRTVEYQHLGNYDFLRKMVMKNVQSGSFTELTMDNVVLDSGIDDDLFQEKNLKRNPM